MHATHLFILFSIPQSNIGRAIGLTIGSILIAEFGIRVAYLTLGILAGVTSIIYLASYHLWLKKIEHNRINSTKQGNFK